MSKYKTEKKKEFREKGKMYKECFRKEDCDRNKQKTSKMKSKKII